MWLDYLLKSSLGGVLESLFFLCFLLSKNKKRSGPVAQFWLERASDKREVGCSSQLRPTGLNTGVLSSIGRAPPLQGGGCRFDPDRIHDKYIDKRNDYLLFERISEEIKEGQVIKREEFIEAQA